MPIIEPVAAFSDNYIWLLHDDDGAHVVDPGDAAPVLAALEAREMTLATIILTHHHFDHVGGVKALKERTGCRVIGPDNSAISDVDETVRDGDVCSVGSYRFEVIAVPGHTLDHIAYYQDSRHNGDDPLLFCGDTLFAGGCGRIFEGDPPMMYGSLQRLAALQGNTRVYCAHEYTLANLAFARAADPDNAALRVRLETAQALRRSDIPTVPSTVRLELDTNPFLRGDQPGPREALLQHGRETGGSPVEVFAALRAWKDEF